MRKMLFLIDLLLHAHTKKWKAVTVQTTVETRKALILYGLVRGRAALYPPTVGVLHSPLLHHSR